MKANKKSGAKHSQPLSKGAPESGTSFRLYEMQAEICGALSHPIRLQILDLIIHEEMTSTELQERLQIPKANLSQHLTVLRDVGLLQARKEGLYQYLSIAIPKIREACAIVKNVLGERMAMEERQHNELLKELKKL
jgi:ArsR family transcriptional regulator